VLAVLLPIRSLQIRLLSWMSLLPIVPPSLLFVPMLTPP